MVAIIHIGHYIRYQPIWLFGCLNTSFFLQPQGACPSDRFSGCLMRKRSTRSNGFGLLRMKARRSVRIAGFQRCTRWPKRRSGGNAPGTEEVLGHVGNAFPFPQAGDPRLSRDNCVVLQRRQRRGGAADEPGHEYQSQERLCVAAQVARGDGRGRDRGRRIGRRGRG